MRLSSGLVGRYLLFKGLLCLWGQIVPLLFVSGHLWVMLGFGIWWGLRGRVGSTGGATFAAAGVHIHFCGNGRFGFRPYGESLFQTPKRNQKASPQRPAPRLGSAFLRSGIHLGASPPVGFASTSSRCVRLRRTALRAYPPDEHLHSASRRGG